MFAHEQFLLSMATHPDVYFEAVNYLQQMSLIMVKIFKKDLNGFIYNRKNVFFFVKKAEKCDTVMSKNYANEATNLYDRAINSFMKHNMLIYFSYCDFEEVLSIAFF